MSMWLRATEAWLLGGWFGSWALFALVIAPTAFRTLPSAEIAGEFVGPVLRALHYFAIGAGVALFAIGVALKRSRLTVGLPAVLAVICAVSQFGVSAAIGHVRPSGFGPSTPADAAGRFHELHMLSRVLFAIVLAGTGVLIALHSRAHPRVPEAAP